MKVRILGTYAPYCKGKENCSGYLIETAANKILLDCGNGTTSQLNMEKDLNNLTIIISHSHSDHYADLLSLAYAVDLYHKLGYLKERVKLYLPKKNYKLASGTTSKNEADKEVRIDDIHLRHLAKKHYFELHEYDENTTLKLGKSTITFHKTEHSLNTYATRIEDESGVFVYSADTGYVENSMETFAQEADLFLCEASFLTGQKRETNIHLYASEAGKIAKLAKVKKLMLTHFWPEIPKEKYLLEAKTEFTNTTVATTGEVLEIDRRKLDEGK